MPSLTADLAQVEEFRAELERVLHSEVFSRSPSLSRLLSYLCEKTFAGESQQIKEYSIALDVFGRQESFDQEDDSIVRVQANRLRKRLGEYYEGEGRSDKIHITIPVGQYVPEFIERQEPVAPPVPLHPSVEASPSASRDLKWDIAVVAATLIVVLGVFVLFPVRLREPAQHGNQAGMQTESSGAMVGLPVGDEVRILSGSTRPYVDRAGKLWRPDEWFTGGTAVRSPVQHVWRTQDPTIYRTSRQGNFYYDIPLKPGVYELHLHFAETFYGPEDPGGGGEGSRIMTITANGKPLLSDFDVLADAGGGRTADVKVFSDTGPAQDGFLHLAFSSAIGGQMISGIEILPGYHGHIRPVRIVARDVPYYSNNSQWWSSDSYFKGGQLAASEVMAAGTDDSELYETERWGHFSYAVPVTPGKYTVTLHFIERGPHTQGHEGSEAKSQDPANARIFDVFCNAKAVIRHLNIGEEVGMNSALVRKVTGLEPNAQGKLLLDFVPLAQYATVSAIEVVPE